MKIKFEDVGRDKATWVADYPREVPMEAAVENASWWRNQLRGKLRFSAFVVLYDREDERAIICAGFRVVGQARIVTKEGGVA